MSDQRSESVLDLPRDSFNRVWPQVPDNERCQQCGQPDNTGDCTHERLTDAEVLLLGGYEPVKWDDFMEKVLGVLPWAEFGEDNEGQIVVYTNLETVVEGDTLVVIPMAEEEPEDDDDDV